MVMATVTAAVGIMHLAIGTAVTAVIVTAFAMSAVSVTAATPVVVAAVLLERDRKALGEREARSSEDEKNKVFGFHEPPFNQKPSDVGKNKTWGPFACG